MCCGKKTKPVVNSSSAYFMGICEVHKLVNNDYKSRLVKFCSFCNVNICAECEKRYDKRFLAALKKNFGIR